MVAGGIELRPQPTAEVRISRGARQQMPQELPPAPEPQATKRDYTQPQ